MFYFSILITFFLLLFLMHIQPWTKWVIFFGIFLIITSHLYVQTYEIKWNIAFISLFLVALFMLRVSGKQMGLQMVVFVIGLAIFYDALSFIFLVYHEFLRFDLWLLRGLCFFVILWIFEHNLLYAGCIAMIAIFFGEVLNTFMQLKPQETLSIGSMTVLNESGFLLLGFIFFAICERIQTVEKNYG